MSAFVDFSEVSFPPSIPSLSICCGDGHAIIFVFKCYLAFDIIDHASPLEWETMQNKHQTISDLNASETQIFEGPAFRCLIVSGLVLVVEYITRILTNDSNNETAVTCLGRVTQEKWKLPGLLAAWDSHFRPSLPQEPHYRKTILRLLMISFWQIVLIERCDRTANARV